MNISKLMKICQRTQLLITSSRFLSRAKNVKPVNLSYKNLSIGKFSTSIKPNEMEGSSSATTLHVDFEGLLKAQKDNNILIIDVREQGEIDETGKLPGSIHIPMGKVATELETLKSDDFQRKYQKLKPSKDTKIVLSCRSGVRSGKVQKELQELGYKNAYNYTGGWTEWENRQKS